MSSTRAPHRATSGQRVTLARHLSGGSGPAAEHTCRSESSRGVAHAHVHLPLLVLPAAKAFVWRGLLATPHSFEDEENHGPYYGPFSRYEAVKQEVIYQP